MCDMVFGGFQKSSLIDYPGKISCVLFLKGCNFDCPYCHNPGLVKGDQPVPPFLNENWLHEFLEDRKGFLEGVVITGGEPTLDPDILTLCGNIKRSGYPVKLDTNGSRPRVLKKLMDNALLDYIAMDVKTDPFGYPPEIVKNYNPEDIAASIKMIMSSPVPYEFRTTCMKPIISKERIDVISRFIEGATLYALQRFQMSDVLHPEYFKDKNYSFCNEEMEAFRSSASKYVKKCIVR